MRRKTAIAIAIAVGALVALVVGLGLGLKPAPSEPREDEEGVEAICASRGLLHAKCEALRVEWDASKRNVLASCEAQHVDRDARNACFEARMTRTGAAKDLYAEGAVYPETYPALRMRVASEYVCEGAGGALVVGGDAPVLVRFAKRGAEWTIETHDAARVVVVAPGGALALAKRPAARFVVGGTDLASEITLAPVARAGSSLRAVAGGSVEVRLERPVGLPVDVRSDAAARASLEYAANVAAMDKINSGCCAQMLSGGKCEGASAAAQRARHPLCCGGCADADARWCAWRAAADASVLDETGDVARQCCASRTRMLDVGPDYASCESDAPELPGQYAAKCEPKEEHTFTFVPAGVWALAPNGVRVPAYGRVLFMRTVNAGYRGVRCA